MLGFDKLIPARLGDRQECSAFAVTHIYSSLFGIGTYWSTYFTSLLAIVAGRAAGATRGNDQAYIRDAIPHTMSELKIRFFHQTPSILEILCAVATFKSSLLCAKLSTLRRRCCRRLTRNA